MIISDLGKIPYAEGLEVQLQTLESVKEGGEETILICSHDPVLTKGRATQDEDIQDFAGETFEVQRGGRVTFHGPSQIIAYPIVRLEDRGRDLHKYLRNLEEAILLTLNDYSIEGKREKGATGVWVGDKKIASIGIAAKKWVTYHGLAFNYENEFSKYGSFSPCGFKQTDMVGFVELLEDAPSRSDVQRRLANHLKSLLLV